MDDSEPQIEYPIQWEYRLIGRDAAELRAAAASAAKDVEHEVRFARQSSKGSYVSMTLTLQVSDEAHRNRVWKYLTEHESVLRLL